MDITISLIIPIYNVEAYLKQCLDSVVKQSSLFQEVILINDGSTDGSLSVCEKYLMQYDYFKLISQENKGLSAARNQGIEHAFGEYIMFLDADDYLHPDTVKRLKEQIEKWKCDAVFFDAQSYYENINNQNKRNMYDRSGSGLDGEIRSGWEYFATCYPRDYVVSACMAIYRKKRIDDIELRFPEGLYYEDNYFSIQFLRYADAVVHISDKLYQRRYRENSITRSRYSEKKFVDYIKVSLLIWKEVSEIVDCDCPVPKELFVAFVSDHCIQSLRNYQMCLEQKILLQTKSLTLLKQLLKSYFELLKKYCVNICTLELPVLVRVLEIIHDTDGWALLSEEDMGIPVQEMIDIQKKRYIDLLKRLPFHKKGNTLGIYGTGKHTEGLLSLYEKWIGEIQCELVFIDSQRDHGTYKGRRVTHYQRIPEQKLDGIVVSSFIYEREMARNVESLRLNIPIYTFYQEWNGDVFSRYEIFEALERRNDGKKAR